jgi:hypothetical protein
MIQCPYGKNHCFLKYCVDMSKRPDRLRGGRETTTGSARAEKVATRPHVIRWRKGERGLVGVIMRR